MADIQLTEHLTLKKSASLYHDLRFSRPDLLPRERRGGTFDIRDILEPSGMVKVFKGMCS